MFVTLCNCWGSFYPVACSVFDYVRARVSVDRMISWSADHGVCRHRVAKLFWLIFGCIRHHRNLFPARCALHFAFEAYLTVRSLWKVSQTMIRLHWCQLSLSLFPLDDYLRRRRWKFFSSSCCLVFFSFCSCLASLFQDLNFLFLCFSLNFA